MTLKKNQKPLFQLVRSEEIILAVSTFSPKKITLSDNRDE